MIDVSAALLLNTFLENSSPTEVRTGIPFLLSTPIISIDSDSFFSASSIGKYIVVLYLVFSRYFSFSKENGFSWIATTPCVCSKPCLPLPI